MISGFPKFKQYTEAQMPLPTSVPRGTKVFNSTYNVELESNGTRWIPLAPFFVYSAALADEVTSTVALTTFREIELPFKYIGKNGQVRFFLGSENNNNANGKVVKVYLNDGTTQFRVYDSTNTTSTGRTITKIVQASGTEYNFWCSNNNTAITDSSTGNPPSIQLLSPTTSLKLRVAGQLVNSGDFVRLTLLSIQIFPGF